MYGVVVVASDLYTVHKSSFVVINSDPCFFFMVWSGVNCSALEYCKVPWMVVLLGLGWFGFINFCCGFIMAWSVVNFVCT